LEVRITYSAAIYLYIQHTTWVRVRQYFFFEEENMNNYSFTKMFIGTWRNSGRRMNQINLAGAKEHTPLAKL
jgi:hypothetical protein